MSCRKSMPVILALLLIVCNILPVYAEEDNTGEGASLYTVKEGEESPFLAPGSLPELTENSYRSENVSISITSQRYTVTTEAAGKQYRSSASCWFCDIYIRDITSLRRACANDKFGSTTGKIGTIAEDHSAVIAVNGDYASDLSKGVVVVNGIAKRKTSNAKRDMLVIEKDGTCRILPYGTGKTYSQMLKDGLISEDSVWQMFLFGPSLLDENGSPLPYQEIRKRSNVCPANPRTVFGYFEPGHYCFMVCDGRTSADLGLRLEAAAQLMSELGCKLAYNLDGGQSTQLWFSGSILNKPYKNGRRINDIVMISEPVRETDAD